MRFGFAHRVMTSTLAVLGVLALVTSGRLNIIASVVICVGLAGALLLPEKTRQSSAIKFLGVVVPIAFLALQLLRLLLGQAPIPVIVEFTAGLQVVRLATRRGAVHDHQVILLALLQLIVGTVLGSGLAYAFSLLGFLVFTPGALVLSHLRREVEGNYQQGAKDRSGSPVDVPRILRSRRVISGRFLLLTCILSVPIFLMTSFLFVLFPRVGFSWFKVTPVEASRVVGFSEHVDLGGVGKIRANPRLVMRVKPLDLQGEPPQRLNFYLRGASFDHYENGAWEKTVREGQHVRTVSDFGVLHALPKRGENAQLQIDLEPIQPRVLFLPERTSSFQFLAKEGQLADAKPRAYAGANGEVVYFSENTQTVSYLVYSLSEQEPWQDEPQDDVLKAYLSLPESFSDKMSKLAQSWSEGSTDLENARSVEAHLRSEYTYDLSSDSGEAEDPLSDFLFRSKRGHCEFYSSAMVLFLRYLGIPARNVTGFVGGSYNRFGDFYGVRQGDAHSWVEAYLEGRGWTRFDPTPPGSAQPLAQGSGLMTSLRELMEAAGKSWEQNVVGFDLKKQVQLARSVRDAARSAKDETRGLFSWLTRSFLFSLLGLAGVIGVGAWFIYRKTLSTTQNQGEHSEELQRGLMLYEEVERTLLRLNCRRPTAVPPLKHAQSLVEKGQPCAQEILEFTQLYLDVRFKGQSFSEADLKASKERLRGRIKAALSSS